MSKAQKTERLAVIEKASDITMGHFKMISDVIDAMNTEVRAEGPLTERCLLFLNNIEDQCKGLGA